MKARLSSNRNWSRWSAGIKMHNKVVPCEALPPLKKPRYSHSMRFLGGCAQKAAVVPKHLPFPFQITALKLPSVRRRPSPQSNHVWKTPPELLLKHGRKRLQQNQEEDGKTGEGVRGTRRESINFPFSAECEGPHKARSIEKPINQT